MMTEALANIHINNVRKMQKINKTKSALNVFQMKSENLKRGGSFVVGQKLRESKWFEHDELGIFCAVVETGFIIEHKTNDNNNRYGIAIWSQGFEKSKNPEFLTIYTITENKGKFNVLIMNLMQFWPKNTFLRINNKSDKEVKPLNEDIIKNQINFAENSKRKWHNSEHFAYFCRYGPVENSLLRLRRITDLKWNPGHLFLKLRSLSSKQD